MILHALILAQALQEPPKAPRRDVSDPGVVATEQRVTPAGIQTVFDGRVGGVRFGTKPGELWVAVPRAVYRLAWSENHVLASAAFDGHPGMQGVAIDPVTGRAIVSSVGRLPADPGHDPLPENRPSLRPRPVTHITAYAGDASAARPHGGGDSSVVALTSPALGDFMAGAAAVARRANSSGHRVVIVPLPANDALAVLDAGSGALIRTVPLGVLPVASVISQDGAIAYVTNFGGPKARAGDRAAPRSAATPGPSRCALTRAVSRGPAACRASIWYPAASLT